MNKEDYLEWLFNWFNKQVPLTKKDITQNFFTAGWVDSFKTLELIAEIEATFSVHFTDEAFNSKKFSTIEGLSEIIFELKHPTTTTAS